MIYYLNREADYPSNKMLHFHLMLLLFQSSGWCLTLSLSISHWYPGSGVVLDCIDSWSLHPYLLQTDILAGISSGSSMTVAVTQSA